jgi:hypothetical protein
VRCYRCCRSLGLFWEFALRIQAKKIPNRASLSAEESELRAELIADVRVLGGEIGERNMARYQQLIGTAAFIEDSFFRAGLQPRRDGYELHGRACHNIEMEIRGVRPEIIVIGAHYDSVLGSPGANDNGSGIAALLALARRFAKRPTTRTMRFVAFVNEEPPYFLTEQMGSFVYAKRCNPRR